MGRKRASRGVALLALFVSVAIGSVIDGAVGPDGAAVAGAAKVTAPGTIVTATPVFVPDVHGTVYKVRYLSQWYTTNKSVTVTGLIFVPSTPAPPGGYPVVSWAHGTTGIADQCAPSRNPSVGSVPHLNDLLDRGWLVVATDYQGLGDKKTHPYLVGVSEGRSVIDIVRAARSLVAAQASTHYVVWGLSQGGHSAMFASNIGTAYAPELHMDGVVADSGPSDFAFMLPYAKANTPYYLGLVALGYEAAYGKQVVTAKSQFTKTGWKGVVRAKKKTCGAAVDSQGFAPGAFTGSSWPALLAANDPASFVTPSGAPLLLTYGGTDTTVPVATAATLTDHLCALGQDLERWIYPNLGHGAGVATAGDSIQWMADRIAGEPTPDPYVPVGTGDVETAFCP